MMRFCCHTTLFFQVLYAASSTATSASPETLPWSDRLVSNSSQKLQSDLSSRAVTIPLGTTDWIIIIEDLFAFLPIQESATTLTKLYNHIADIATVTYVNWTPVPVLVFNFGPLSLELSSPMPIPSLWLYTFVLQMLPMVESGGLVGEYRVRFVNTVTHATLLARLAVRGAGSGVFRRRL